jgi:hypothetical protein
MNPHDNKDRDELKTAILHFDVSRGETGYKAVTGAITKEQADKQFEGDVQKLLAVADAYTQSRVVEEAKKYCDDGHYHDDERDIAMLPSERLAALTDNQERRK